MYFKSRAPNEFLASKIAPTVITNRNIPNTCNKLGVDTNENKNITS